MAERAITDADIERMTRGFELFNSGRFDGLREFLAEDVVMERVGGLPPLVGWDAVRRFFEPDAFESQQIEVIDWEINGDLVLLQTTIRSRGAGSGLEVEIEGWFVWTVADHVVTRIRSFRDETDARAAVRMDPR